MTTAAPPTPAAKRRVVAWHGDGTPAPKLENTGTDYVAIFLSLERQRLWLQAHHPDPALVPRVWVYGMETAKKFRRLFADQQRERLRFIDVGDRSEATVASVLEHIVTLRVNEYTTGVHLLDTTGRVVESRKQGPVFHFIVLLSQDGDGRWTIASVDDRVSNNTGLQL
jgi:hypothetical protein